MIDTTSPLSRTRSFPVLLAAFTLFVLTLAMAPTVRADAALENASPGDGESVDEPVDRVDLTFSGPVELDQEATRLLDSDGNEVTYVAVADDDGATWSLAPDTVLAGGDHGVIWEAKSADGHTIKGTLKFAVTAVLEDDAAVEEDPIPAEQETVAAQEQAATAGEDPDVAPSEEQVADDSTQGGDSENISATETSAQSDGDSGGGSSTFLIAGAVVIVLAGLGFVVYGRLRNKPIS